MCENFYNPYDFVGLSEKKVVRKERSNVLKDQMNSGVLHCSLKTKTPMFIASTNDDSTMNFEHAQLKFFNYDGETPVIPASSIRGTIRSVYETITNSCLSTTQDLTFTTRDVPQNAKKGGILKYDKENKKWLLYLANVYTDKNSVRLKFESEGRKLNDGYIMSDDDFDGTVGGYIFKKAKKEAKPSIDCFIERDDYYDKDEIRIVKDLNYLELKKGVDTGYVLSKDDIVEKYEGGIYKVSNDFGKDHYNHIFVRKNKPSDDDEDYEAYVYGIELKDKKIISSYIKILEQYRDPKSNSMQKKDKAIKGRNALNLYEVEYQTIMAQWQYDQTGIIDEQQEKLLDQEIGIYFSQQLSAKDGALEKVYLSPAQIGRNAYDNTLFDLLKKKAEKKVEDSYISCANIPSDGKGLKLCPACQVFGMVKEDKHHKESEDMSTSRVYFTDGNLKNNDLNNVYGDEITLEELLGPKYSNVEMYMTYTGNDIEGSPTPDYIKQNDNTIRIDDDDITINGRKFYWHHKPVVNKSVKKSKLNQTIRPVNEDVEFTFDVIYEDLTKEELETLIFALELTDDELHCHKIGGAKPLGYGSCLIKVESWDEKKFDLNSFKRIWDLDKDVEHPTFESIKSNQLNQVIDEQVIGELKKITSFKATDEYDVCYPYKVVNKKYKGKIIKEIKGYKWFTDNKKRNPYSKVQKLHNKKTTDLSKWPEPLKRKSD